MGSEYSNQKKRKLGRDTEDGPPRDDKADKISRDHSWPGPNDDLDEELYALGGGLLQPIPASLAPVSMSSGSVTFASAPPVIVYPCGKPAVSAPTGVTVPFRLRLQLWNIQDLGGGPSRGPVRPEPAIKSIARVIHAGDADITTIIEVHRLHRVFPSKKKKAKKVTVDPKKKDHLGFSEVLRIVDELNAMAGETAYGMYPSLADVKAQADPAKFYTHNESYAFIYRVNRVSPRAFNFIEGFKGRAPGRATFLIGKAQIDLIAHHPPAENARPARARLRRDDFKHLLSVFAGERKPGNTLVFYLADTNIDTRGSLSENVEYACDAMTKLAFLRGLSDDERFSTHSLFRRAPTSHRKSAVEVSFEGRVTELVNPERDFQSRARVGAMSAAFIMNSRRTMQDAYGSRFKAFDKICVVHGSKWAFTSGEWVVPLLHAVAHPKLFEATVDGPPLLSPMRNTHLRPYQSLISRETVLFEALCESKYKYPAADALSAPVSFATLPDDGSRDGEDDEDDEGAGDEDYDDDDGQVASISLSEGQERVRALMPLVDALSDHAPCITEFILRLPLDYPGVDEPAPHGITLREPVKDGGPGLLTPWHDYIALPGIGRIRRLPCLAQGFGSSGTRAVWNARACTLYPIGNGPGTQAAACTADHAGLVARYGLANGTLPTGLWDFDVGLRVAELDKSPHPILFLRHSSEVDQLRSHGHHSDENWARLHDVGLRKPGSAAVLVVNAWGYSAAPGNSSSATQTYIPPGLYREPGMYIVVDLFVQADGTLDVTYVDSVPSETARRALVTHLITGLDRALDRRYPDRLPTPIVVDL